MGRVLRSCAHRQYHQCFNLPTPLPSIWLELLWKESKVSRFKAPYERVELLGKVMKGLKRAGSARDVLK